MDILINLSSAADSAYLGVFVDTIKIFEKI
jgi:hypothetical protein